MVLLTTIEHLSVSFEKSAGSAQLVFEAGREYVVAQSHFNRLIADEGIRSRIFKFSRIENRIPNFIAPAPPRPGSKRLLIYNGSGGYGDQIMTWPFAAIMKAYGYDVHVLVDPGNVSCWWNFPWIKGVHNVPMQYEEFKMFDYWAMFETVVNAEEHQDQLHPLDQMLLKVGVNPDAVDAKLKCIRPNFTFLETQGATIFQGQRLGLYQLAAANPVRCLPPGDSAFLLSKLADAYPNLHWLALYDKFVPETYPKALHCPKCAGTGKLEMPTEPLSGTVKTKEEIVKEVIAAKTEPAHQICPKCKGSGALRPNIQLHNATILRELWALSASAAIVVAPDSMMVHVAGCMDIPCVGLWGPCDPSRRVKYYKNHYPIWKRETCQFAPCFAYAGTFPRYCPPRPNRTVCECLGAIAPNDVIDQIKKIIPLPA